MAIIEVQSLWKKFRLRQDRAENISTLFINLFRKLPNLDKELWALKDISFTLQEGKSLGIIGANGSGKSTLLKILTGTLRPTRGQITVRGRRSSLIELGAGFHPDFSGRDNVYLNGLILGMSRAQVKRKFDEIVAFAELEQFIDVPVKYYSSGMQARLGFAVATAVEPEILIVDEVLAVGDGNFQQKCLARIREMQRRGTSILLVSHSMNDIETICDEALWLHRGEIVRFGKAKDVVQKYQINQGLPPCAVR